MGCGQQGVQGVRSTWSGAGWSEQADLNKVSVAYGSKGIHAMTLVLSSVLVACREHFTKDPFRALRSCFARLTTFILRLHVACHQSIESIIKVYTVAASPNWFMPWQTKQQRESTGSGFIVEGNRIITNAHCVADQAHVMIRKHGDPKKYSARVVAVGHEVCLFAHTSCSPFAPPCPRAFRAY